MFTNTLGVKGVLQMTRLTLTWVLLAAFPIVSQAGPDEFDCKVLSLSELSKGGTFETGVKYQKEQIGSTFSVERKTGAIRGGFFLHNRSSKTVRVINEPQKDAYYVISESHGPFVMVSYLYIANHFDGPAKPFTYTHSGQYVYSGLCQ